MTIFIMLDHLYYAGEESLKLCQKKETKYTEREENRMHFKMKAYILLLHNIY